jgi:hypothetical protein
MTLTRSCEVFVIRRVAGYLDTYGVAVALLATVSAFIIPLGSTVAPAAAAPSPVALRGRFVAALDTWRGTVVPWSADTSPTDFRKDALNR